MILVFLWIRSNISIICNYDLQSARRLKPIKCVLLGNIVSVEGVAIDPNKVAIIWQATIPKTTKASSNK